MNNKTKQTSGDRPQQRGAASATDREAYMPGILATISEAIISIDASQRIVLFNTGAEHIFGYSEEEVLGKSIDMLIPPGLRETHASHFLEFSHEAVASRRMNERSNISGCRKNGETFPAEASITKVEIGGEMIYTVILRDITDRVLSEKALRQTQGMEAVGQLTGGLAHDFNNLLAVILGHAEFLHDEIGDHRSVAMIERAATRGAELTRRLLAFSRQQALQPRTIDLVELLAGIDVLFRRTLGKAVEFSTHLPKELWPVTADPRQLESALLSLAINARDAMPDGGTLEIECSNIGLREGDISVGGEGAAGDYVQIAVRDTGTGIPEGQIARAFEPDSAATAEGSGLGLSMVYGFVRQSGGDAAIESEPGKGTEVRLLLPRAKAGAAADEPAQEEARQHGQQEIILVLEDDPDVRFFAVAALVGLGYRVLEAADASAAMQVLEAEDGKVDLLLSDVVLPGGVSGPEIAAKAKNLYPNLKLVFMSGYAANLYTHDKIPGFDETLLSKPFKLAYLAKVIHDTLAE
ncbi:MAG: PAS domain-containing sensor histidine kinase [Proteobacteria bacterium]|nr:MAG: PAS domain-containing sensor histidine kinase [Pseudomonadota bacterium]